MSDTIRITGLDDLIDKLKTVSDLRFLSGVLSDAAQYIEGKIKYYPPMSEANSPNAKGRWYQRGYGPRWTLKGGGEGGSKTSEDLKSSWTIEERNNGMTWVIGTNVTYAPFVNDRDRQAGFHEARGWPTAQQVAEDESAAVVRFIMDALDDELK